MVNTEKTYNQIGIFIIYLYLLLFPFGQLLRFNFGMNFGNLADLVVLFTFPLYFSKFTKTPEISKKFLFFIGVCILSLTLSLSSVEFKNVIYGSIYLIRLFSYFSFGVLIYNLINRKILTEKKLLTSLLATTIVSAFLGWGQYIFKPNLVFLKYMDWDDHLNRLVGTFLDPGFTGIILSFGFFIALYLFFKFKKLSNGFVAAFLLLTIMFTYSRATFIALIFGIIPLLMYFKKSFGLFIFGFAVAIIALPKLAGEGTNLLRTQSSKARLYDYAQTIEIIKANPIFGVGFNNLCNVRTEMFKEKPSSHACSGSASSILFILATTGVVGLMVIGNLMFEIWYYHQNEKKVLIHSVITALLIHSLFVQSLFYSFVMGYLAILFGAISSNLKGSK